MNMCEELFVENESYTKSIYGTSLTRKIRQTLNRSYKKKLSNEEIMRTIIKAGKVINKKWKVN